MKLLIPFFMLFPLMSFGESLSPKTLQEAESYTPLELQNYRQTDYKRDDPAGDYALLKRSELVPKRIFQDLLGIKSDDEEQKPSDDESYMDATPLVVRPEDLPPEMKKTPYEKLQEYCVTYPVLAPILTQFASSLGQESPEDMEKLLKAVKGLAEPIQGRENPLLRDEFKDMFQQVIVEEKENGIEPSYGEPHTWSKEFLDKHGKSSPMLVSSKLLMALAVGETNRYMKTDKEEDLYKWMSSREDNSLEIDDVFRESYRINKGDVYKTLLTIENVLAHQWQNPKREKLSFVQKLKPITSGYEYDADKFGTWYHLFGIMLYGYVASGVRANLIGRIEALGSNVLSPGVNKNQKQWMNKQGGLIGADLAKVVKKKTYQNHTSDKKHLKETSYLDKNEDFRDRIKLPVDKDIISAVTASPSSEERTYVHIKDVKKRNLKNCHVEMIADKGRGFDSREKEVRKNVNITESNQLLQFHVPGARKVRGFVSCENLEGTIVFESK